jgi:hypothetical protein
MPYGTRFNINDPDIIGAEEIRLHEVHTKTLKALYGPTSPVYGDNLEGWGILLSMTYIFPLNLGNGLIYETIFRKDFNYFPDILL